ncbi:MAG TPA: hypothetical protein VE338_06195 [Ktedonobacterales bacterium]|nr:hypothetical protein [Ktedonobacterales bacterium]
MAVLYALYRLPRNQVPRIERATSAFSRETNDFRRQSHSIA